MEGGDEESRNPTLSVRWSSEYIALPSRRLTILSRNRNDTLLTLIVSSVNVCRLEIYKDASIGGLEAIMVADDTDEQQIYSTCFVSGRNPTFLND